MFSFIISPRTVIIATALFALSMVTPVFASHSDFHYEITQGTLDSSMPASQGVETLDQHGFRFFCLPSHFSYDDPVVYPGQSGRAHLHMFYGNVGITHESTSASIINTGASSCDGGITNRSGYWVPALFTENDEVKLPNSIILYYKSWVSDRSEIQAIPQGLQILASADVLGAGDVAVARRDTPSDTWGAQIAVSDSVDGHVAEGSDGIAVAVNFPNCIAVDGNGDPILTSPGGTSHVAYGPGGCPASHPYTIPTLTQNIYYEGVDYESDWYFASDHMNGAPKGTTVHADYMAGWTEEAAEIMAECVRIGARECGPPLHGHWDDRPFNSDDTQVYDYFSLFSGVDSTPDALNGWAPMLGGEGHIDDDHNDDNHDHGDEDPDPTPEPEPTPDPESNSSETGAEFMLFGNWPLFESASGYAARLAEYRSTFEALQDEINANRQSGQPVVYTIPVYELLDYIREDIAAGTAVGAGSLGDLFDDDVHLSPYTNYGVTSLVYATVFGRNPNELPTEFNPDWQIVTAAEAAYLKDVAWEVANDYAPAGLGTRLPTELGAPHVFSGNSQINSWFEYMYQPALRSNGASAAQSIIFGSTAEQRWANAESVGVQLPASVNDYELLVASVGPYFNDNAFVFNAEADALQLFADAAWEQGQATPLGQVQNTGGNDDSNSEPSNTDDTDSDSPTTPVENTAGDSAGGGGVSDGDTSSEVPQVVTTIEKDFSFNNNISFNQPQINFSSDVEQLETFLNQFEGESLVVDGVYGSADNEAMKRFQRKYKREILDVWGLTDATGYVGITSRLKINFLLKGQTAQCPAFIEYNGGLSGVQFSTEIGKTQEILQDLGMYSGAINNTWDAATNQAMITFQETFKEVMLDPWNISEGTGYKYKTTNKFLNYFAGCDTGAVNLEGVGVYEGI